jgi:acyl-coenzyme A synthetase/AMP-(fatty) acid ligase
MKKVITNNGKKGGWLVGKPHYDKNGKPLGGIKAVVTDAGNKPVELEGGEVIINKENDSFQIEYGGKSIRVKKGGVY